MTKDQIIEEFKKWGEFVAIEAELGEQLLQLTVAQKKAHNDTRLQADKCRNLEV